MSDERTAVVSAEWRERILAASSPAAVAAIVDEDEFCGLPLGLKRDALCPPDHPKLGWALFNAAFGSEGGDYLSVEELVPHLVAFFSADVEVGYGFWPTLFIDCLTIDLAIEVLAQVLREVPDRLHGHVFAMIGARLQDYPESDQLLEAHAAQDERIACAILRYATDG